MEKQIAALRKAIKHVKPATNVELARRISVTPMRISQWLNGEPVGPRHAKNIERACAKAVRRGELIYWGDEKSNK